MSSKFFNFGASAPAESAPQGSSADKSTVRHVLVHISGNRASWDHLGIHGALWRVNTERATTIFGPDCESVNDPGLPDRLCRALIKKVTVLESNTNISDVVAVSIDGLPHKEFSANGQGAALFLTGEGRVTAQQEIFNLSGNTEIAIMWMKQYPLHTAANLEDQGVMFLPGTTYYFVHEGHPVINMLKTNQDQFGVLMHPDHQMDGHWFKVDLEAFQFCVKMLRETVLHNAPSTFNLSSLAVRITKPDSQRWMQMSPQVIDSLIPDEVRESSDPTAIQAAKVLAVQRYVDKPLHLTLRLAFEYALPDAVQSASAAPTAGQPPPDAGTRCRRQAPPAPGMMGG